MIDLSRKSIAELLKLHADVSEALRDRRAVRTANNPTGDYGEYLFCEALTLHRQDNSVKSFDAKDARGVRYQIKARRLHRRNQSRVLGAIRDLTGFDLLAAVLFDDNYRVLRAAVIPVSIVRDSVVWKEHTNSYRFILSEKMWDEPRVIDATEDLRLIERRDDAAARYAAAAL